MPIKNLVSENLRPGEGFPRIGKLHKGAARTEADLNSKRPGKDLQHFRMTFEPQFEYLAPLWHDLYGNEPDVFDPVYIYGETVDAAFDFWKEEWTATKLMHRCDGESQVNHFDNTTGMYNSARIACAAPSCQCKAVGRLNLLLPDFADASGVLGYVLAETHSLHDIIGIHQTLKRTEQVCGTLTGVPFRFGRAPETISVPKFKGGERTAERMKVEKSLFFLHVNEEYTRVFFLPALRAAAPQPLIAQQNVPQLTAGDVQTARVNLGGDSRRRLVTQEPVQETSEPQSQGDIVEAVIDDTWTADALWDKVSDLCSGVRAHFDNALKGYTDAAGDEYILKPEMTLVEAEAAVRLYRSMNNRDELSIFTDEKRREGFIGSCITLTSGDSDIVRALDNISNYALAGIAGWKGDKFVAWAAVLAFAGNYRLENVPFPENASALTRALVRLICEVTVIPEVEQVAAAPQAVVDAEFASL